METTGTIAASGKKLKRLPIKGFVAWIVKVFKPGYHLALNPPKGAKRKKVLPIIEVAG
jgi:hypothetical protein